MRYLITFRKFKKNCKWFVYIDNDYGEKFWHCSHVKNLTGFDRICSKKTCPVLKSCDEELSTTNSFVDLPHF